MPCPSQYADWIEELADEGITAGCGSGNFCPTQVLGSWQMLAWAQKIWPGYCPLPRTSVLTYRDEGARVITEANQLTSSDDTSETITYPRDNVFLGSQLVSSAVWTGTTPSYQFFAVDHLGSTRLATDMAGMIVESYKYWPYGDDGPGTGAANQRLTFAGMERDTENKHYFDHARTQDFNLGRFVSADRAWGGQGAPQSWNRYSYVMNKPTSLTDPWGYDSQISCPKDPFGIIQGCSESITAGGDAEPASPSNIENDWAHRLDWYLPTWNSFRQYQSRLGSQGYWEDDSFGESVAKAFLDNLFSIQFWKNELGRDGCLNVFVEGFDAADILAPVLAARPDIGETTIRSQAATLAVGYSAVRNLNTPMRSSIVRNILERGETVANAFALGYFDGQVLWGLGKEAAAIGAGECR